MKKIVLFLSTFNSNNNNLHELLTFRLTLILLVLDGSTGWFSDILLRILCTLMIVFSNYSKNKLFWTIISSSLLLINGLQFYTIDNHKILFTYWTLLLTIYLWIDEKYEYISKNAQIIIGLVMFFAVFQKILHGFLEPGFLHGRFLIDNRFILITHFITSIPIEELMFNMKCISLIEDLPIQNCYKNMSSNSIMSDITYYFQILGLIFEALLSIFFLLSKNYSKTKDYLLIIFCIGTYFIFPVIGFSSILLLLGLSQVKHIKIRNLYIITFVIIQFIKIPWQDILFYLYNTQ